MPSESKRAVPDVVITGPVGKEVAAAPVPRRARGRDRRNDLFRVLNTIVRFRNSTFSNWPRGAWREKSRRSCLAVVLPAKVLGAV
mmetsp:Transcript_30905/g.108753  ORF Transcript_30905/g.108753 Transcript_30905/m.108753 type:complete len:85 (-) Transcript_30905:647-901(-)